MVVPCAPEVGLIDVSVGPVTANDTVFELPMGVVTLTVRDETEAFDATVKVAVTLVLLVAVTLLTVTPLPETTTAVAPDRFVPVSVTAKLVPRSPEVGLMDVSVIAMMVKDCDAPVPALKLLVEAVCATRVQVPAALKLTVLPDTVQTVEVLDVAEVEPLLFVE